MSSFVRPSLSLPSRAVLFGLLLAACSDGAATLPPDQNSYTEWAGASGSSRAGNGSFIIGANSGGTGGTAAPTATGGSGLVASAAHGGVSSAHAGAGGSGASTGVVANGGSSGLPNGVIGTVGSGAAGGVFGNGGATGFGGASLGGRTVSGGAGGGVGVGSGGATVQGRGGAVGAAGATASGPATFAAVTTIIQQNCALAACHGGGRSPRLTNSSTLYKTLTSTTVKECAGDALVKPSDPTNSALLKLPNWECDDFVMPQGCIDMPCLSASDLATITAWIAAGAPSK